MTKMKTLLKDFVDTHVHAGPTLTVREFNVWQLVAEAEKGGFSAIVLKDHFVPTVPVARAIQEKLGHTRLKIFGSLALNNSVGGLNPKAVEIAIGFGAKMIWMPTISAANHCRKHRAPGTKFPVLMKKETVADTPLNVIDANGVLTPETEDTLNLLADHPDRDLAVPVLDARRGEIFEVGPRMSFSTAWSTNAVAVCHACGLGAIRRIERSRRFSLG